MCDCVISLTARVQNQVSTRRLRVLKYRGSSFGRNEYPYVITEGGIQTAPISTMRCLRYSSRGCSWLERPQLGSPPASGALST